MACVDYEAHFTRGDHGEVSVAVYSVSEVGQLGWIADEEFGPFETALDVTRWLTRVVSPLLGFPLR